MNKHAYKRMIELSESDTSGLLAQLYAATKQVTTSLCTRIRRRLYAVDQVDDPTTTVIRMTVNETVDSGRTVRTTRRL